MKYIYIYNYYHFLQLFDKILDTFVVLKFLLIFQFLTYLFEWVFWLVITILKILLLLSHNLVFLCFEELQLGLCCVNFKLLVLPQLWKLTCFML